MREKKRIINTFGLVAINIAALGGIRAWAPMAETGLPAVFFLLVAALAFFLPASMVTAELVMSFPKNGGIYEWVKEAFGHRTGFLAIWLLWLENVIWYPTILSFVAATITFAFNPALLHSNTYTISLILSLFWGATAIHLFGIRCSNWMGHLGALCGTFIPSLLVIFLGVLWFLDGNPVQTPFTLDALIPSFSPSQFALFAGILVSLLGVEMSTVHIGSTLHPRKKYPKAILFSALFVIFLSMLGVIAILTVISPSQITLNAGCLQPFSLFLDAYHLTGVVPWIAVMIALGTIGSMSTWIVNPCLDLIIAAKEEDLPSPLKMTSPRGIPKNLLLLQAVVVSILAFVFILMPSINSAYWVLLVLTAQLYLIMYLFLFAAAIKLRYKFPTLRRPFKIPGGKRGLWVVAGTGIVTSFLTFLFGFFPPDQLSSEHTLTYIYSLAISILGLFYLPYIIRVIRSRLSPLPAGGAEESKVDVTG